MTHISLIDYGIGNLRSVQKALEHVGAQVTLTDDPKIILSAEKVVLPGVGAFGDGMKGLRARNLVEVVKEVVARGTPLLGICVGMQVLFESSDEMGEHDGLGILEGNVTRFKMTDLKIPQTGWNQIEPCKESILFHNLPPGSFAYFNHSYYCVAQEEDTLATTDYGGAYSSIVGKGRVYGIQCHPEKSQSVGLTLLRNFVEIG
ncbi:MAG: imidazole glycerol phosphate synthase subunit HisH [Chloroflexota bacterium]